jgi:uncharacterized membrane protein
MNAATRLLSRQRTVAAVVTGGLLVLGAALYASLPDQMAIHWNAAGRSDNVVAKPVAVLLMPVVVVLTTALFEATVTDVGERVVGSLATLLLFAVQVMVFAVNLGYDVPIVPVTLVLAGGLASLAVWIELR